MNLHLTDIPHLPFVAALFGQKATPISQTPEWKTPQTASVSYPIRNHRLVVNPMEKELFPIPASWAMKTLLQELDHAVKQEADPNLADRLEMLSLGLKVVLGKMSTITGTIEDLERYCVAGITARTGLTPEIVLECSSSTPCQNPGALALLLVQLAVNAQQHSGATALHLTIHNQRRFALEWQGQLSPSTILHPSRTTTNPEHWGLAFAQIVADTLGGRLYPPHNISPHLVRVAVEIDINRVIIPVAFVSRTQMIEQASPSFTDETSWRPGSAATGNTWTPLIQAALRQPHTLLYHEGRSARSVDPQQGVWLGIPPSNIEARIDSALHGLDHESDLWHSVNAASATSIRALSKITQWVRTGTPPINTRSYWINHYQAALTAFGLNPLIPIPSAHEVLDVNVCAWLLKHLGSTFEAKGTNTYLIGSPTATENPLWQMIAPDNRLLITGPDIYHRTAPIIERIQIISKPTNAPLDPWE